MNETYEFIKGLRVSRSYKSDPIREEDLNAILEAARWTGSSKNNQDWSFIVVNDHERLQGLAEHGDYSKPIRDSATTVVLVQESGGNMFDIGRAAQNIMLAAKAIGVATCPVSLHRQEDAREYLGAPEGTITRYAVAMGYPSGEDETFWMSGRKEPADIVSYDSA